MGKLPTKELKKLLSCIKKDPRVIIPPQVGFDSGVHRVNGDKYLVVSTDTCTGVPEEWFGWFLIHYVASDIALFGAKMQFCTINLLGPSATKPQVFKRIMGQACSAADGLGAAIVTGHTGTYEGLSKLLGVCTGYGVVNRDRLITPGDARPGDYIVCIKPLGLEIAISLALTHWELAERFFGVQRASELRSMVNKQSCVKEASLLAEVKGVHAMHDTTEGGLTAGLNEIAEASNVGFKVEWEKIRFSEDVNSLKNFYQLTDEQVLSMSSTGTILAAVGPEARDNVEMALRQNNVEASILGLFTEDMQRILVKNDEENLFPSRVDDPYARILLGEL
jgi:hydrogenase expression/formation protein HypE